MSHLSLLLTLPWHYEGRGGRYGGKEKRKGSKGGKDHLWQISGRAEDDDGGGEGGGGGEIR